VSDLALRLNFVLLLVSLFMQRRALERRLKQMWVMGHRWKPQSPHDCPNCQSGVQLHKLRSKADIRP
jgi:hypothetical protein